MLTNKTLQQFLVKHHDAVMIIFALMFALLLVFGGFVLVLAGLYH
jgi:hypothetical protein